jgi:UDP-glucose 4-epimerase
MKTLMTGGPGFMADQLCKKHMQEGRTVISLGNSMNGSVMNIGPLTFFCRNLKLVNADINRELWRDAYEI